MAFKDDFPRLKPEDFPNLVPGTYERTSPRDKNYNCVAWTVGKTEGHWWPFPDYYWPEGIRREETFDAFAELYASLQYEPCLDGSLEDGWEKVAIFGKTEPTHVALQLPTGRWTSKIGGSDDDISHDLSAIEGPMYGRPVRFMRRARNISKPKKRRRKGVKA